MELRPQLANKSYSHAKGAPITLISVKRERCKVAGAHIFRSQNMHYNVQRQLTLESAEVFAPCTFAYLRLPTHVPLNSVLKKLLVNLELIRNRNVT